MIDKIVFYIKKYEDVLLYLIFGVLTTLVNFASYYICYTKFHWINLVSNTVAWILSVMFAFITNKIWVFKSKSFRTDNICCVKVIHMAFGNSYYDCRCRYIKGILADCKGYCKCACSHTQLCFFKIIYF